MTYEETIAWLYSQLPMFSRIGAAAYKEDLHNTIALCDALGNPQQQFTSIHIAGTNGKGSTSHMLAAIFQEAGYKTGLYTSPHIKDFRERIRINGRMIEKEFITEFVAGMQPLCDNLKPSFFELTVAMAFDYFAKEKVDIAIIETGLGGRLDSTNVITPILSIITNIGYDHTQLLGNTLAAIASEKAGIIKENIPVVVGETNPETLPVFQQKAVAMHADMFLAADMFQLAEVTSSGNKLYCRLIENASNRSYEFQLDLAGQYQQFNLRTVLTSCLLLKEKGFRLSDTVIKKALGSVKSMTGLRGRWEIIHQHPTIILDVAHNEAGIHAVLMQVRETYPDATYHFVLGFVQDKDISSVLSLFKPEYKYYFTQAHIPRALPVDALKDAASGYHLFGDSYRDVNDALAAARNAAAKDDVIIVCGSFFTIAELDDSSYNG